VALVLDAGALVAVERGDPAVLGLLREAQRAGVPVRTSSTIVSQVWRDGRTQARLASVLRGVDEVAHDRSRSRPAGELLRATGGADVCDAALVAITADGDTIVTGDVEDLGPLAYAMGRRVTLVRV
jgi:hypothetical protein